MIKVKTFTQKSEIFKTINELKELDKEVNRFLAENNLKLVSVSDTITSNVSGQP